MRNLFESLAVLFGRKPGTPADSQFSDAARKIHALRSGRRDRDETDRIKHMRLEQKKKPKKWLRTKRCSKQFFI